MTDRELMQQALEALKEYTNVVTSVNDPNNWVKVEDGGKPARDAITALRDRLAQPAQQQEPVALETIYETIIQWDEGGGKRSRRELARRIVELYNALQPQMQPCAGRNCGSTNPNLHSAECFEDYEKSTGMSQWQRLTEEEINNSYLFWIVDQQDVIGFGRSIETKLKRKNT